MKSRSRAYYFETLLTLSSKVLRWWPSALRRRFDLILLKDDGLGDFVLALEAIRTILESFPGRNCALVTSPVITDLARKEFPQLTILVPSAQKASLPPFLRSLTILREHAKFSCDVLVDLRYPSPPSTLAAIHATRADRVITLALERYDLPLSPVDRLLNWQPTATFEDPLAEMKSADTSRILEMHARLLSTLGINRSSADLKPRLQSFRVSESKSLVISAMAGLGSESIRNLPLHQVQQASRWARDRGWDVSFLGIRSQRDALVALAQDCELPEQSVLTELSVSDFVDLIANAGLVFSADTSSAHIAAAFDKRTLVVLPGAHYGWFGPWSNSSRQIWLTVDPGCFGCDWACIHPEPYCITRITGSEISSSLDQLLLN